MLKILIVDDEMPARMRLHRMLKPLEYCEVVGEAASGAEALEQLRALEPDVLLLDISMPGVDGMSVARALAVSDYSPAIIFCTAFEDQAIKAFDVEATDYLVKPVRQERLEKALARSGKYLDSLRREDSGPMLRSTVGNKVILTPLGSVICLLSEDKYTTVIHEEGHTVIEDSLTDLEQRFESHFLRIHRNALVARKFLRGLERTRDGRALALLVGTDRKPEISRRNMPGVRKLLAGD
jgi:two-component system response regulator AlgR